MCVTRVYYFFFLLLLFQYNYTSNFVISFFIYSFFFLFFLFVTCMFLYTYLVIVGNDELSSSFFSSYSFNIHPFILFNEQHTLRPRSLYGRTYPLNAYIFFSRPMIHRNHKRKLVAS